jgi:hypothetical protein
LAGPDFSMLKITMGSNVGWKRRDSPKIFWLVRASSWRDAAYENVILHVVWEHDTKFIEKQYWNSVLELKKYVDQDTIANYQSLMSPKAWIFCEKQLVDTPFVLKKLAGAFFLNDWEKVKPIFELLQQTNNDWEDVYFACLAKNFS